jgi:ABC-2 type transport system permease protein
LGRYGWPAGLSVWGCCATVNAWYGENYSKRKIEAQEETIMQKILLVMRHEIRKMLQSTGYVIFAFVIPMAAVLILGAVKLIQARSSGGDAGGTASELTEYQLDVEGFVDQGGLIQIIPEEFQDYVFAYEDEEQAKQALESGEITAYYVIPAEYLETGVVYYVYPDTKSYLSDGQDWVIAKILMANLLDGEMVLLDRIWNPVRYYDEINVAAQAQANALPGDDCARPGVSCKSNDLVRYMPSIMAALFFAVFMTSSSMLFNSIGTEKENRVIEVLMLSVSPRQLLAGKTLGLGIAGLLQSTVWLGAIYVSFNLGGKTLNLPENFTFPVDILIWGIAFFLGGYGLYASLMAGAGALIPKMKEAGVATYIVMFPLFLGYMFGLMAPLTKTADSALLVFLSIFPFTSPVVMIMRQTNSVVPLWQSLPSVLLLFITAYFTLRAVAAMFHTQNLLSGQSFSLKRYLGALIGRQ